MKYLLLIQQGSTPTPRDPEAWERDATTVRVKDGQTLTTDGPFVELREAVGGYLFSEADDLDATIELAARIPSPRSAGPARRRPTPADGC